MTKAAILVTGGAGYIGNHVVLTLLDLDYPVVVLDDLSTGKREAIPPGCIFVEGNAGDPDLVCRLLREHAIDSVMHFAGSIIVEESVEKPLLYYDNNTLVSLRLIDSCIRSGVRKFIFSSTAAVYGNAEVIPVTEDTPLAPLNPYGHSKAMTERILEDAAAACEFNYIALRYFNVAGADPGRRTGQRSKQSTHLIKVACETGLGVREQISVFGDDYPTPDGTCIRDYIHVSDLAMAHVKALEHLQNSGESLVLNCGYGRGYSVAEVLAALQEVLGHEITISRGARRPGDAAELVANNERLRALLDWQPQYDDLHQIIGDALAWERHYKGLQ